MSYQLNVPFRYKSLALNLAQVDELLQWKLIVMQRYFMELIDNVITVSQDGDSVLSFLFGVKNTHFYLK